MKIIVEAPVSASFTGARTLTPDGMSESTFLVVQPVAPANPARYPVSTARVSGGHCCELVRVNPEIVIALAVEVKVPLKLLQVVFPVTLPSVPKTRVGSALAAGAVPPWAPSVHDVPGSAAGAVGAGVGLDELQAATSRAEPRIRLRARKRRSMVHPLDRS